MAASFPGSKKTFVNNVDDVDDVTAADMNSVQDEIAAVENFLLTPLTIARFLGLPGLRGFWPMSSVDNAGAVYDLSGQGRTLTNTGPATFGATTPGLPYGIFNGTTQYLSRADEAGLDITGALTMGGWFYATAFTPATIHIGMGKYSTAAGNFSYRLTFQTATSTTAAQISGDGTDEIAVTSSLAAVINSWHFLTLRYTPSTELAIWVNDTKTVNTTSIPAALFNGNAAFQINGRAGGTNNLFAGRAALGFLCAAALADAQITDLYNSTRGLFV